MGTEVLEKKFTLFTSIFTSGLTFYGQGTTWISLFFYNSFLLKKKVFNFFYGLVVKRSILKQSKVHKGSGSINLTVYLTAVFEK